MVLDARTGKNKPQMIQLRNVKDSKSIILYASTKYQYIIIVHSKLCNHNVQLFINIITPHHRHNDVFLEESYPHHETTECRWMRGQRSTVHLRGHSPWEERMSSRDLCRPELLKQHDGTIKDLLNYIFDNTIITSYSTIGTSILFS